MSLASVITYAHAMIGTPYKFGGNNPIEGIDCSGLVLELMRAAGEVGSQDMTAQDLYNYFESRGTHNVFAPGTLVFYGKSVTQISHVAFMISPYQIIEAGGGGRSTITEEDAAKKGAFVRMRHIDHRKSEIVARIKPLYARIGMLQP